MINLLTVNYVALNVNRAEHYRPVNASEEQESHFGDVLSSLQNFNLSNHKHKPSKLLDWLGSGDLK